MPIILAAAAVVLAVAVLTGTGQHRRGGRAPVALVAGLCFPITWFVWYVRDEQPHRRATGVR